MKQRGFTFLLTMLMCMVGITAFGQDIITFADDNVKTICVAGNWDINKDGKLSRSEAAAVTDLGEVFKGNTDITSFNELEYFTGLTEIGDNAFEGCTALTSVKFPSTLTRIGKWAFAGCSLLSDIDFNGCTVDLDDDAFFGSMGPENLVITDNIHITGCYVFCGCNGIKSVVIEESEATPWAWGIFADCSSLETAVIYSKNLANAEAFFNCTSLRSVTFHDNYQVEKYFEQNFNNVPSDLVFNIPEGTAEGYLRHGYVNLSDKSALQLVQDEFEAEAARITTMAGKLADGDKETLTNAISSARAIVETAEDYPTVLAQIAAIKTAAMAYLTTATLPEEFDVTAATISNPDADRFALEWKFTVSTSGSVGYKNDEAFENGDIELNKFIYSWNEGDGKMYQTISNLPAGRYRLEADVMSFTDDQNVTLEGASLFGGLTTAPANSSQPEHFSVIFENPVKRDVNIGISIDNSNAVWVGADNFRLIYEDQGPAAAPITFTDENVKALCVYNWDGNSDGELSIAEADAVTDLGEVFKGNTDITSFNELEYFTGLTEIGDHAFDGCTALTSVKFPGTLTRIGEWAFAGCSLLSGIDFNGCRVELDHDAFFGSMGPENLVINNNIRITGAYVFYGCKGIKSVVIEESEATPNAWGTFKDCSSLETAVLYSKNLANIEAFFNCTSLKSVTFRDAYQGTEKHFVQNFNNVPSDLVFNIPEGTAEGYLRHGYVNLSDKSALPLVRDEFEAEAARITTMAGELDGDKETLTNAISSARAIVETAEDYPTVLAQIAAIKTAAKTYLTTATLPAGFDVTAATISNPDADRFDLGWKFTVRTPMEVGYKKDETFENGDISLKKFIHSGKGEDGKMYQTINNLPAGIYRLEADVMSFTDDQNVTIEGASLFGGSITASANSSLPEHFSVKFENPVKRDVNIGISINNSNAVWVGADNFRLYYEGPAAAAPEGTELVSSEDATYYIYNVGTGMYLNGGNGWGTQAVLAETGLPVRMTKDGDDYWQVYFREGSRFQQLLFKDQSGNVLTDYNNNEYSQCKWIVTKSDGSYTIQSVDDSGSNYVLGNDPTRQDIDLNQNITLDTHIDVIRTDNAANNTRWKFIKKADYDLLMAKRYLLSTIFRMEGSDVDNESLLSSAQTVYNSSSSTYDDVVAATTMLNSQMGMPQENQPIDMTALITNPRFENNTTEGWTGAKLTATGNANNTQSQTHEFYMTSFNMSQRITGLPNGLYRLKWKGFHRPGNCEQVCADFKNGTNNASAVVYANDVVKTMKHIYTGASDIRLDESDSQYDGKFVPFRQWGVRAYFDEGLYADYLEVEVTNNVLTIGVKNIEEMGEQHWVIFSDFELEILQNADQYNNRLLDYAGNGIKGGKAQLPILMNNEGAIAGIQFKIRTPEGITVATDNESNPRVTATSRISGMTLMASQNQNEGYTQVLIYGVGKSVKENSGAIVNVALDIANTLSLGDYDVDIYDIVLTESNGLRIAPFSVKGTVTLVDAQVGDANRDGAVDVADIIAVANKILGHPSAQFDEIAANVNGDSSIDVADIIGIANIILHGNQNLARSMQTEVDMLDPQ